MLHCDFRYQHAGCSLDILLDMQNPVLGIVGRSGAGKSTLLKCVAGILQPKHGVISCRGRYLFDDRQQINIPVYQRRIAMIFQQPHLFPHLNVYQNLLYGAHYAEKNQFPCRFQLEDLLEILQLTPLLKRGVRHLSGGEAQRVAIGRAILSSPDLILLDEPLTGLDDALKRQVLTFLKHVQQKYSIPMIYVTHYPQELDVLNAERYQLIEGRLVTSA